MSKRAKPLSVEEKRKRLCEIFYDTKDFYMLKDLEKIAPKSKGIIAQTVKEILQSLVDDELVVFEKIGASNYYWSFPSTALQSRRNKINQLEQEVKKQTSIQTDLESSIEAAKVGREDSEDRTVVLQELASLEAEASKLSAALQQYKELDPDLFDQKKKELQLAKEAANRWTDNIFSLQTYCGNKFGISKADFDSQFEIPDDFDYVE